MEVLVHFRRCIPKPVFRTLAPAYHFLLAALAALRYGFPSRSLTVIGVTGTDGKTTVVHLLHEMLRSGGYAVGSISSLRFKINDQERLNLFKMTMPGRFALQRFLAECRAAGCRFAILEVTSQGILQSRHRCIRFSVAVLTNVTPEHLEAHGGFEAYRGSKIELFRRLPTDGFAILNRHDGSSTRFAASTAAHSVWYSPERITIGSQTYPVRISSIVPDHIELAIGAASASTGLGGEFNVANILAASAAALTLGVSPETITAALSRVTPIPGRLEFVVHTPFPVVVDYANTPQAYEAMYQALIGRNPKLICVFGAPGGGRDKWKRPALGKIAARYCTSIILTSDDPDDEDPRRIAAEIQGDMTKDERQKTNTILDRRQAIRAALRSAAPGDAVIITGMGAQPWFVAQGGKRIPWDDRAVVREELAAL